MLQEHEIERISHRLHDTDVFRRLTDEQRRRVAAIGHMQHVAPAERLAEAGSRGHELYVVLSGELRLFARHGEVERVVRRAHARETVPLAVLLDPPVLVTAIEGAVDAEVFTLPRAALIELCDADPAIGLQVYRAAARSFEERYRSTLDNLVHSLRSALSVARSGAPGGDQPPN